MNTASSTSPERIEWNDLTALMQFLVDELRKLKASFEGDLRARADCAGETTVRPARELRKPPV